MLPSSFCRRSDEILALNLMLQPNFCVVFAPVTNKSAVLGSFGNVAALDAAAAVGASGWWSIHSPVKFLQCQQPSTFFYCDKYLLVIFYSNRFSQPPLHHLLFYGNGRNPRHLENVISSGNWLFNLFNL